MAKSLRWIVVLTSGWEPPEEEKAQFIAEVVQMKSLAKVDEFSYIPKNYTQEKAINFGQAQGIAPIRATLTPVPSLLLQDSQIIPYLRSEMPNIFSESSDFEVQWEKFFHSGKRCEGIIIFLSLPEISAEGTTTAPKMRKMVQQIRGIGKDKIQDFTPTLRRSLSPIQRGMGNMGDNVELLSSSPRNPDTEKTHVSALTPNQPIEPVESKVQPSEIPLYPEPSAPQRFTSPSEIPLYPEQSTLQRGTPPSEIPLYPEPSAPQKSTPPQGQAEDWNSFLTGLQSEVGDNPSEAKQPAEPEQPPVIIPKTSSQIAPKTPAPRAPGTQIPQMYQQAQAQEPQEQFAEWQNFVSGWNEEAPAAKPPQEPTQKQSFPKEEQKSPEGEWSNFFNEITTGSAPSAPAEPTPSQKPEAEAPQQRQPERMPEPEQTKKDNAPHTESRFLGRGLFLTQEEIALEEAVKKTKSERQQGEKTPSPTSQASVEQAFTPTVKRASPGFSPTLVRGVPQMAKPPTPAPSGNEISQAREETRSPHHHTGKTPVLGNVPVTPPGLSRKAVTPPPLFNPTRPPQLVGSQGQKMPLAEGSKKAKKTGGRLGWLVFLLLIAAGAGAGFFYREQIPGVIQYLMEKVKPGNTTNGLSKEVFEKELQQLSASLPNNDAKTVAQHLDKFNSFLIQTKATPALKDLFDKASLQKKEFVEKTKKSVEENVKELRRKQEFKQVLSLVATYNSIGEIKEFCSSLEQDAIAEAEETARGSISLAQGLINKSKVQEAVKLLHKINQNQLPVVQEKLKAQEGLLLKGLTQKYHQKQQYRLGIEYLAKYLPKDSSDPNANLKTSFHILWLAHQEILQYTSKNQYDIAQKTMKYYHQHFENLDINIKTSDVLQPLKKFQYQINEEKALWKQLVRGLEKNAGKAKCSLEYYYNKKIEKIEGKIVVYRDVYDTGKFDIQRGRELSRLHLNSLTTNSHYELMKDGDVSPYRYGLYLFSQGKIEEAKQEFLKVGRWEEFQEKLQYRQ